MGAMQRAEVIGIMYNVRNKGGSCTHLETHSSSCLVFLLQYLWVVKTSEYFTYNSFVNRYPQVKG